MSLNALGKECWESAERNGWHKPRPDENGIVRRTSTYENCALIASEVTEAFEAFRKHGLLTWWKGVEEEVVTHGRTAIVKSYGGPDDKLEGFETELADIIIRTCELAVIHDIDLDAAVASKLAYNSHRDDVPVRANTKAI
jgi:NTP pyrophosphatase (non-canonical NTP hydrolase)